MEAKLYWDAVNGRIGSFRSNNNERQIEQLLTPNKNTVLHIHITASKTDETEFVEAPTQQQQTQTTESLTIMEAKLYWDAVRGRIGSFNNELQIEQLLTPNKNTVLHIHITASKTGETEFVDAILRFSPSLLLQPNAEGEIPLHLAARYGHKRIVELLIERARGTDPSSGDIESGVGVGAVREMLRKTTEPEKNTALHEAVRLRHLSVVTILTQEDPNFSHPANRAGETPFYLAVEREYLDIVRQMLSVCSSINASGPNNRNALHAAVISLNIVLIKEILQNMAHLTGEADDEGCVPLHYAVKSAFGFVIVKMLLRSNRYAAYRRDNEGRTPLHIAASLGRVKIMKKIIQTCPDSCELVDNRGQNVLHFAVKGGLLTMKVILKESSFSNLINKKDNEGNAPLHIVAASNILKATFLLSHFRLDKMAFNDQNQNVLDIVPSSPDNLPLRWNMRRLSGQGLRKGCRVVMVRKREMVHDEGQNNNNLVVKDEEKERRNSTSEAILVVATLIATVAFAAGFTLPGGYVSDKGPLQGTAVLRKKAAFQLFMISDMMALIFSTNAVITHLILALKRRSGMAFIVGLEISLEQVLFAMLAMMIAFVSGIYAVLEPSMDILIPIVIVSILFFFNNCMGFITQILVRKIVKGTIFY